MTRLTVKQLINNIINCHLHFSSGKCPECVGYRSTLQSMHHKSQTTSTHNHTNERWLNSTQLRAKASQLRERVRSTEKKLKKLEKKIIKASTEKLAVNVGDSLHNDLQPIMRELGRTFKTNTNMAPFIACFRITTESLNYSSHPASLASYAHTLVPLFKDAITCCI